MGCYGEGLADLVMKTFNAELKQVCISLSRGGGKVAGGGRCGDEDVYKGHGQQHKCSMRGSRPSNGYNAELKQLCQNLSREGRGLWGGACGSDLPQY